MSTVCVTDAELVALARQGDHEAFGELVTRHQTAVYRAALAAVGSPAEAEDASPDAFVSAYRRLGSFRGDASFKTWLLTIAWNHAINRRRRLTRWPAAVLRSDGTGERSACGHASPSHLRASRYGGQGTSESEGEHQRKNALGVGPQRQWKKLTRSPPGSREQRPSPAQSSPVRSCSATSPPKSAHFAEAARRAAPGAERGIRILGRNSGDARHRGRHDQVAALRGETMIRLRMRERGYADVG